MPLIKFFSIKSRSFAVADTVSHTLSVCVSLHEPSALALDTQQPHHTYHWADLPDSPGSIHTGNLILTAPTKMSAPEVSHGRGGAGNITPDDTKYADSEIVRAGDEGTGVSTGRGGA